MATVVDEFQVEHRRSIRLRELDQIASFFPEKGVVLEIGAGAGWQAKVLSKLGFKVIAIDLPNSNYRKLQEYPVMEYDGKNIPLTSGSVDYLFSSNVLEHVEEIAAFQWEMMRVLRPGGIAVHVMPTLTWRVWTTLTLHPKRTLRVMARKLFKEKAISSGKKCDTAQQLSTTKKLCRILFGVPHGVRGSVFTEGFYFSRFFWANLFRESQWEILGVQPVRLFYTGNRLFGRYIPISVRRALSYLLGSSCIIYVLRNPLRAEATGEKERSGTLCA
jgi:SAM-dependent methyltransferase